MVRSEISAALRACRGPLLLLAFFSACINFLALASPIYMLQLYDRVLSSRSQDTLLWLTVIVIAALAVLSCLEAIRRMMLTKLGAWLDDRLGPMVLASSVRAAGRDAPSARAAAGDLSAIRSFFTGPTITPFFDAPWSPLFIGVLFLIHPLLGMVGVAAGILLLSLAVINEMLTRRAHRQWSESASIGQQFSNSVVQNADVIRAMGMLDGVLQFRRDTVRSGTAAQAKAERRGALVQSLSKFSRLAVQTAIMGVGAWLVIHDQASPGVIFAGSFLLSRALAPIDNAIGTWKSIVVTRAAYKRLDALMAADPPRERGMPLPVPLGWLRAENVSYFPPGCEEPTLRNLSFDLPAGEVLGIVGPSAAGKSTLARLIAGSCNPTRGHVRLDGADLDVWQRANGAHHVGYLPQDVELFDGTIQQNISRFTVGDSDAVVEAAQLAGLHGTIMRLPQGYETPIGAGGMRLSGGLKQRVGLARAVFGFPRLLVLDEPNASLDQAGEEALHNAIVTLKTNGVTILVVTHRPSVLSLTDKLLLICNGAIEAYGTRESVIARVAAVHRAAAGNVALNHSNAPSA